MISPVPREAHRDDNNEDRHDGRKAFHDYNHAPNLKTVVTTKKDDDN